MALASSKNAVSFSSARTAKRFPSHHAVIRVYDSAGNVIETPEHAGDFKSLESVSQFVPDVSRIPFPMPQGAPEAQLQMRKIVLDFNPPFR
jgi:hypothetical protein